MCKLCFAYSRQHKNWLISVQIKIIGHDCDTCRPSNVIELCLFSQEIASEFLEGTTNVETFLSTFLKESSHAHSLKVKTEKLRAIATRLRQGLPLDDVSSGGAGVSGGMTHAHQPQPRTNFYSNAGGQFEGFASPGSAAMPTPAFYR